MRRPTAKRPEAGLSLDRATSSLTDRIYDLMREQIVSFELAPFDPVSDKRIAERLGVSRTPVREALVRLAAQRLVDIFPQRGTVVAPMRRTDLERSQFTREALEIALVRRVAELEDRTDLVRNLRAEIALQETFAGLDDDARLYASDEDFHRLIATYAGLPGIWDDIQRSKVHMDRARHLTIAMEQDVSPIIEQHRAIVDAIEHGDKAAAADTMRVHLRRVLDFVDMLQEQHPDYFENLGGSAAPSAPAATVA